MYKIWRDGRVRLKARDSKSRERKRSVGSNPTLSAINNDVIIKQPWANKVFVHDCFFVSLNNFAEKEEKG
jgi:hypothetical protein